VGVFVSLFRGINVGGHHSIKMDALRKLHESLGFTDVAAVLQSGNVVFRAKTPNAADIEAAFEKQFGFHSAVTLRSAAELHAAAAACPFRPEDGLKPGWITLAFFPGKVDAAARKTLEAREGPEQVRIAQREIYIYYTEGIGRSKLQLKGAATVRNWNTVTKLLELAETRT
jgi:uncharacterized protein (DUF1697 family)